MRTGFCDDFVFERLKNRRVQRNAGSAARTLALVDAINPPNLAGFDKRARYIF
jgi:hypothetical protein